mgnify:CR=1 FL=1
MKTNLSVRLLLTSLLSVSGCLESFPEMEGTEDLSMPTDLAKPQEIPLSPFLSVGGTNCDPANGVWTWTDATKSLTGNLTVKAVCTTPTTPGASNESSASCITQWAPLPAALKGATAWLLSFEPTWKPASWAMGYRFDGVVVSVYGANQQLIGSFSSTIASGSPFKKWAQQQQDTVISTLPSVVTIPILGREILPGVNPDKSSIQVTLTSACSASLGNPAPAPATLELKNLRLIPMTP